MKLVDVFYANREKAAERLQTRDDSAIASGGLVHPNKNFRDGRQICVHTRAKLDEAQMLADKAFR